MIVCVIIEKALLQRLVQIFNTNKTRVKKNLNKIKTQGFKE